MLRIAEEVGGRKKLFRWCGRGRPKPQWTLSLTIKHEIGETTKTFKMRAASKYEAAKKAFQRTQALLGGLVLKDWQNPRLQAELSRRSGDSILGGMIFILQGRCKNYMGALKANGPQQMFKEVSIGRGRTYQ